MTFRMYYGAASGSAQKALRTLEEPNVLISAVTKNNREWEGIERLFVDSGGYSVLDQRDDYPTTDREYAEFLGELDSLAWYALRDFPVSEGVLDRHGATVREHQQRTTERHVTVLDAVDDVGVDAAPVAVLQGRTAEEYVRHFEDLRDRGVATDRVGVGSLKGRDPATVATLIRDVREALPARFELHGFGVSRNVLAFEHVAEALDSADSCAYERRADWATPEDQSKDFRRVAHHYLQFQMRVRALVDGDEGGDSVETIPAAQSSLSAFDELEDVEEGSA